MLKIAEAKIEFIGSDDPPMFKYLGRLVQFDLEEYLVKKHFEAKLVKMLDIVDAAPLEGRMKAWIVNHHVCSKVAWTLMVQNFSDTKAKEWQQLIHSRYRKWFGLAKSAEPSLLYRSHAHFGLKLKHLVHMKQQLQVAKWHTMKHSKDEESRKLYEYRLDLDQKGHIGQGRKTSPCLTLEHFESAEKLNAMTEGAQSGHQGLGFRRQHERKLEPRQQLIKLMKDEAEAKRVQLLHDYSMQSNWLIWGGLDEMMKQDHSWQALLYQYSQRLLKFMLNAQLNTLPSPDNLRRWNANKDAICGLCTQKHATLNHILAGCPWVRGAENKLNREDRYTWRHNNVLLAIYLEVKERLAEANNPGTSAGVLPGGAGSAERKVRQPTPEAKVGVRPFGVPAPARPRAVAERQGKRTQAVDIKSDLKQQQPVLQPFVKAGSVPNSKKILRTPTHLLHGAKDWVCDFDLPECRSSGSAYVFPYVVCQTSTKIDGYIISHEKKVCIGLELTCPMEENIVQWHSVKQDKYEEITREAAKNGWRFEKLVIEVGARGFIPQHVFTSFKKLDLRPKALINRLTLLAQKCSYVIWLNRFNQDFQTWRLVDSKSKPPAMKA